MSRPVTEFAILRLKVPTTSLDELDLRRVSAEQSAWSGFPLYWFTYSTPQDTFACILSQWTSVPAHQAWIDSPQNQALLELLLPKLDISAFCHIDLHSSRSEIQLDDLFQARQLSWRKLEVEDRVARSGEGRRGDACGWAIDASEPTFYVFRIDEGDGSRVGSQTVEKKGTGGDETWTTMSRLDFPNL